MGKLSNKTAFGVALGALLLAGCATNSSQDALPGVKLWSAYSSENLMADINYSELMERDSTLRFAGLQGEEESAQLMITPSHYVLNFNFVPGEVSDGTHTLPASSFKVYAEYYQDVTKSNELDSYYGYYPDALIPIEAYQFRKMDSILASHNQGLWVIASLPSDAPAGTYRGEGTLTLDGQETKIPLEVKIYGAAMPEQVHEQSTFYLWYDQIKDEEGVAKSEDPAFQKSYYDFAVDHRCMPNLLPPTEYSDPASFATYVAENIANNPKVSCFGLPYKSVPTTEFAWGYKLNADYLDELFSALTEKELALRKAGDMTSDLFKKALCYFANIIDEPQPDRYDVVRDADLQVSKIKAKYAALLSDYPDLQKSVLSMKNLVTAPYSEDLQGSDSVGGVETWCPTFENFSTADQRALYASIQKGQKTSRSAGEHVWWYGCIRPISPYSSYHLDAKLITARLLPWMEKDYGVEGNLYWGLNYWRNNSTGAQRDVWRDPAQSGDCNGDGVLMYPGRKFGINGPISTLRLENIREGEEEYEYLWLFEKKIAQYNQENGKQLQAMELLAPIFAKLFDGVLPKTDSAALEEARHCLLGWLEAMEKDLKGTVESL